MRVQVVDPSAFTPPYDHALCAALARRDVDAELVTSRFLYGPVPEAEEYGVNELFYRRTAQRGLKAPARRAFKLAEHVPDMRRLARHVEGADLVHYQWLTAPTIDRHLLPAKRPRVFTVHYPLPTSRRARRRERGLLEEMDAVVAHSKYGARRLRDEAGLDPGRIRVIPHGAFDYLTRLPEERPLPDELREVDGPVVLCFGLIRPYKGIEVLLEAFRSVQGAELWIAGMPRMDLAPLRQLAANVSAPVRFVPRFIPDPEIPAYFRRADIVALPYLDIEQSGVLYTGLAFGKPMIVTAVGGFTEVAEDHGAARTVPPGDPASLADAINILLANQRERDALRQAASTAAAGPYSWHQVAAQTVGLYRELLG